MDICDWYQHVRWSSKHPCPRIRPQPRIFKCMKLVEIGRWRGGMVTWAVLSPELVRNQLSPSLNVIGSEEMLRTTSNLTAGQMSQLRRIHDLFFEGMSGRCQAWLGVFNCGVERLDSQSGVRHREIKKDAFAWIWSDVTWYWIQLYESFSTYCSQRLAKAGPHNSKNLWRFFFSSILRGILWFPRGLVRVPLRGGVYGWGYHLDTDKLTFRNFHNFLKRLVMTPHLAMLRNASPCTFW